MLEVDPKGLAKLLERKGPEWLVFELVQNAWDTRSEVCHISVEAVPGKPRVHIAVMDEDPDGFKDLSHAWTLFAESEKKDNSALCGLDYSDSAVSDYVGEDQFFTQVEPAAQLEHRHAAAAVSKLNDVVVGSAELTLERAAERNGGLVEMRLKPDRDFLARVTKELLAMNMTSATLFPGLDGIAQNLAALIPFRELRAVDTEFGRE